MVELSPTYFEVQSDVLMAGVAEGLLASAGILRRCPSLGVLVRGYAAVYETEGVALSQRRADVVQAFLLRAGVAAAQVADVSGRGQDPGTGGEVECADPDCETVRAVVDLANYRGRRVDTIPVTRMQRN